MQLPEELQRQLDRVFEGASSSLLKQARTSLTETYARGSSSCSIFKDPAQKLAYLATRMPATYAAVRKALREVEGPCTHFLDLGAGPGTASWAAVEQFGELEKVTCVELSPEAVALGKQLAEGHALLERAVWVRQSLLEPFAVPEADVAVLSYVLNELPRAEEVVKRIWEGSVRTLVLIEPGTPRGFEVIRALRQKLLDWGAYLVAPCPHREACPMQNGDWCHFSARLERTRLHRILKEGSLGYEDEKFSYVVASKTAGKSFSARIVRSPQKGSGHVRLALCTEQGLLESRVVTRSNKENYKKARDSEWGDVF